jgi:hypothetical protein
VVSRLDDLRLIRFEGGRMEVRADPRLDPDKPSLEGVFPDHWCGPRVRLRQAVVRPGRFRVSLIATLPTNTPLVDGQQLRFRGTFGASEWERLGPGETRTFRWSGRIEDPRFELLIEARNSFERGGRRLAVRVTGFALERIESDPSPPR